MLGSLLVHNCAATAFILAQTNMETRKANSGHWDEPNYSSVKT